MTRLPVATADQGTSVSLSGTDAETRYTSLDVQHLHMGGDKSVLYSERTGRTHIVGAQDALLVLACQEPRTLRDHASAYVAKTTVRSAASEARNAVVPRAEAAVTTIEAKLRSFVAAGLLEAERTFVEGLVALGQGENIAPVGAITAIGIPTRGRTGPLHRALTSYLANDVHFGRQSTFIVMDDGESDAAQRENHTMLLDVAAHFDRPLSYASRTQREAYAARVASCSGVPESVVRFAFLGDSRCSFSLGAVRNCLLADTIGERTVHVDDDTICAVHTLPNVDVGVHLTSEHDPNEYWFWDTLEAAIDHSPRSNRDFLGVHEAVLGRSPLSILGEAVRADLPVSLGASVNADLATMLSHPTARVDLSMAGVIGQLGGPGWHQWRLRTKGSSFGRLIGDEKAYPTRLYSRELTRCPSRLTLTNSAYCIGCNLGLNNTHGLPPFMPVQPMEDIVFGAMKRALLPQSVSAFVPYSIVHDPRSFRPDQSTHVPMAYYANRVLRDLVFHFQHAWPKPQGRPLHHFGAFLIETGHLPPRTFGSFIREIVGAVVVQDIANAQLALMERKSAPEFWKASLRSYVSEAQTLAVTANPAAPSDFSGGETERQTVFQDIVVRFGELLLAWPAMMDAAVALREAGARMSTMLG